MRVPEHVILGSKFLIYGEGEDAKLWLGGEMEVPINQGASVACHAAVHISEECGYLTSWVGMSAIRIEGGEIPGYVVLDWHTPDNLQCNVIRIFKPEEHWLR